MDADNAADCDLLEDLYWDAVSFLEEAGVPMPPDDTPRRAKYDLCVKAIVLENYDNRGATSDKSFAVNPAFRNRINQLKLTAAESYEE